MQVGRVRVASLFARVPSKARTAGFGGAALGPGPTPPPPPAPGYPTTFDYYLSPSGNDTTGSGTLAAPWKTFKKLEITPAVAGKRVGLLDGTYSVAAGTGVVNFNTANSGVPPSGSAAAFTEICAVNMGMALLDGAGEYTGAAVYLGRKARKDSYIKIRGIRARGDITLYNTTRCYIKDCGVQNGAINNGTNDTNDAGTATLTNTYNLIEDFWVWGYGARLMIANYQGHYAVWRRGVIRTDNGSASTDPFNMNCGSTIYNSQHVYFQNVLVVDRDVTGGTMYADFASAQHDGVAPDANLFYFGDNHWQGCASINSQDEAFQLEFDNVQSGMVSIYLENCVAWPGGFSVAPGGSGTGTTDSSVNATNLTSYNSTFDALRFVNFPLAGYVRNAIAYGATRYGSNVSAPTVASYIDSFNNASGDNNAVTNGSTVNPLTASLLYPMRVEAGSPLKGAGLSGADIGANIIYRYGTDGAFHGDAGFDTLSTDPIWPYPNEALIKSQMSEPFGTTTLAHATRGFCASGESLTHYVWNQRGNGSPY